VLGDGRVRVPRTRIAGLVGWYVFGDYCGGQIWALRESSGLQERGQGDPPAGRAGVVRTPQLLVRTALRIASFAEQPDRELLVVDQRGGVYHLVGR